MIVRGNNSLIGGRHFVTSFLRPRMHDEQNKQPPRNPVMRTLTCDARIHCLADGDSSSFVLSHGKGITDPVLPPASCALRRVSCCRLASRPTGRPVKACHLPAVLVPQGSRDHRFRTHQSRSSTNRCLELVSCCIFVAGNDPSRLLVVQQKVQSNSPRE